MTHNMASQLVREKTHGGSKETSQKTSQISFVPKFPRKEHEIGEETLILHGHKLNTPEKTRGDSKETLRGIQPT